jgi:NADH dehydrogenase
MESSRVPNRKKICVLGGTGFVGQYIVEKLAKQGHHIRVLSRHRERNRELLVLPTVEIASADVHNGQVLKENFADQDVVINLVGILNVFGKHSFEKVHADLARKVADACQLKRVPRLLHMSALKANANNAPSKYLRSKGQAENIVHSIRDVDVTSFRPSVIFGPQDDFFNRFAKLLAMPPKFMPFPLACANAKFAPVYVKDVANAFVNAIDDKETFGKRFCLCGPHEYSLLELVKYTADISNIQRKIIPLGNGTSKLLATFMGMVPGKPLSIDNFNSTRADSICDEEFPNLAAGSTHSIESIVPGYLGGKSLRGRYSHFRKSSGRT